MAQIVMEIMSGSKSNGFAYVPLDALSPLHPVDNREDTIAATEKRAEAVFKQRDAILQKKTLSKEEIAQLMPSVTYIRAVPSNGGYTVFEGNGRLAALQKALTGEDIQVEIDIYHPRRHSVILKKIKKLAKMY